MSDYPSNLWIHSSTIFANLVSGLLSPQLPPFLILLEGLFHISPNALGVLITGTGWLPGKPISCESTTFHQGNPQVSPQNSLNLMWPNITREDKSFPSKSPFGLGQAGLGTQSDLFNNPKGYILPLPGSYPGLLTLGKLPGEPSFLFNTSL